MPSSAANKKELITSKIDSLFVDLVARAKQETRKEAALAAKAQKAEEQKTKNLETSKPEDLAQAAVEKMVQVSLKKLKPSHDPGDEGGPGNVAKADDVDMDAEVPLAEASGAKSLFNAIQQGTGSKNEVSPGDGQGHSKSKGKSKKKKSTTYTAAESGNKGAKVNNDTAGQQSGQSWTSTPWRQNQGKGKREKGWKSGGGNKGKNNIPKGSVAAA